MKKNLLLALCLFAGTLFLHSCSGGGDNNITEPLPTDSVPTPDVPVDTVPTPVTPADTAVVITFAKGADPSWLTEMEHDGVKFYDAQGNETECLALLKQCGINAIRLRVWVNPEKEYCNYNNLPDVLAKARRAHALGMELMIDFHYSDWFADPGRQNKPVAWEGMTATELKSAIATHTCEVLTALQAEGITPRWVQVGNETRNGMIWPSGKLWEDNGGDIPNGWNNYTALHNTGYEAVKAVCPEAIVIVHIDNAWDDQNWWFQKFFAHGGKADMIGLSHYPQTHDTKGWQEMNNLALQHIAAWGKSYNRPVMVCEVGVKSYQEALAATVLTDFITRLKNIPECAGVFYWEPQVYNNWKPAIYNTLGWGAYGMGAFTTDGKPAKAMEAFR